jgi:outer membrane protein, multidrug efflux system
MRKGLLLVPTGLLILFSACTVGPNYHRVAIPAPPAYRGPDNVPSGSSAGDTASLGDQKWWTVFKDPVLQDLIRTALKQNYDVRIAATRVLQAQSQLTITRSNQFPNASAGPGVTGTRQPGIPNVFPGYSYLADTLTASVSWNLDFWGRYRRATEAARANLRSSEWGRRAVMATLVENVATAYFQLREYDLELAISKQTLESRQQSLKLTQTLEQGGSTSMVDVRQAEQLVEQAAEAIPQTEQEIQQEENQLSILLAENPGSIRRGMAITEQPVPDTIPAGIPSQLLERRPDIQEAEQNLIAANAQIGVARAQLFPQVSLTGDAGYESIGLHNLFAWSNRTWTWAGQATQPIFNAGALRANVRFSEAQEQQELLTYQQSIQTAFREVSDSLIAFKKLREFREHQDALTRAAQDASNLAKMRYQGGVTSYLEVLTNDTNYFSAELGLARARLNERLSVVQLYDALGGGWQL